MILLPLLFLLSPGFGPASAQQTRPNNMVTVSEGEDALLKCDLSSENSVRRSTFDWRKDHGEQEVFMYENGKFSGSDLKGQSEQFIGRVVFFKDKVASGNASIKIKNTRLEDNGTYSCNVMNPVTSVVHIILNVVGVLKTRENVTGAAREPQLTTVDDEGTWRLLECKAAGVPEPEVEWRNSSGTVLAKHVPQNQNGHRRPPVVLEVNVTRSDRYTCVVTQRSIYHQISYSTKVHISEKELDRDHVAVLEGDDAVLPCSLDSEENMEDLEFSWSTEHEQVFLYDKGRVQEDGHFRGRITHFPHELKSGNASIKILKTQMFDSGRFTCHYSHNHKSHIVLTVVGNPQSNMGSIIAVVLAVLLVIFGGVLAVLYAKGRLTLGPNTGVSSKKEQKPLNGTNISGGFDRQQMDGESE